MTSAHILCADVTLLEVWEVNLNRILSMSQSILEPSNFEHTSKFDAKNIQIDDLYNERERTKVLTCLTISYKR